MFDILTFIIPDKMAKQSGGSHIGNKYSYFSDIFNGLYQQDDATASGFIQSIDLSHVTRN